MTTLTALSSEFGTIKVSGTDATSFLQSQLSNDITLLNDNSRQISSYNSAKGRVYAVFTLIKLADHYLLVTTGEQIPFLVKRLSMFVMRSDVSISDYSPQAPIFGFAAKDAEQLSITLNDTKPVIQQDNKVICQHPNDSSRYFLIGEPSATHQDDDASIQAWLAADIKTGLPHIFAKNSEEFVAQMINLDIIDGVNFKKGCYPGQEIVARMKYLGKLKKRMFHISFAEDAIVGVGDSVYTEGKEQSIGQLVYTAKYESKQHALAVINIEVIENDLSISVQDEGEQVLANIEQSFAKDIED